MIAAWFRSREFLKEDDPRRAELVRLAKTGRRLTKSTPARPTRWQPQYVQDPDDGNNGFTNDGAWELVAFQARERPSSRDHGTREAEGRDGLLAAPDNLHRLKRLEAGSTASLPPSETDAGRFRAIDVSEEQQMGFRLVA